MTKLSDFLKIPHAIHNITGLFQHHVDIMIQIIVLLHVMCQIMVFTCIGGRGQILVFHTISRGQILVFHTIIRNQFLVFHTFVRSEILVFHISVIKTASILHSIARRLTSYSESYQSQIELTRNQCYKPPIKLFKVNPQSIL